MQLPGQSFDSSVICSSWMTYLLATAVLKILDCPAEAERASFLGGKDFPVEESFNLSKHLNAVSRNELLTCSSFV